MMNIKLRQLRKQRGISITFMSEVLGFAHPSGYANIEYGLRKMKLEQAKTVADVLNVSIDDLV